MDELPQTRDCLCLCPQLGVDEVKGFPPLHSCEELFFDIFQSWKNQGLDTVYPLEYIIYYRDCLSDSFEKCTWSGFLKLAIKQTLY